MNRQKLIEIIYNKPFKALLPLLFLYVLVAVLFTSAPINDEIRYYTKAQRIIEGQYSPAPKINLWSGPGYPLVLVPFVYFKLSPVFVSLLNGFFVYLSLVLLVLTIRPYVSPKTTVFFLLFPAFYLPMYAELLRAMTEPLAQLLIMLVIYFFMRALRESSKKWLVLAGLALGYLAITRVIFGWLSLFFLLLGLLVFLFKKKEAARSVILCSLMALVVNIPYLSYTYQLTGKIFYWSNSGGQQLYCMSTPYQGEYGNWFKDIATNDTTFAFTEYMSAKDMAIMRQNHESAIAQLVPLGPVAKDETYFRLAINNILTHPLKYFQNIGCNISRMLFNQPYSYSKPSAKDMARIPFGVVFLLLFVTSVIRGVRVWKDLPDEIKIIALFILIYLTASAVVSAYPRQLNVMIPGIVVFAALVAEKFRKRKMKS